MKTTSDTQDMLFTTLTAAVFGALVGIGTSSWCLGLAGSLAMIIFILKGR